MGLPETSLAARGGHVQAAFLASLTEGQYLVQLLNSNKILKEPKPKLDLISETWPTKFILRHLTNISNFDFFEIAEQHLSCHKMLKEAKNPS